MRKGLAPLVFALFSAMFSPVHASDIKINPKVAQTQNLYGLTQDEVEFCSRTARQIANNLRTKPYFEDKGIVKNKFIDGIGKCIADEFNQIAPPGYRLERVGDEYWLRAPGLISSIHYFQL